MSKKYDDIKEFEIDYFPEETKPEDQSNQMEEYINDIQNRLSQKIDKILSVGH